MSVTRSRSRSRLPRAERRGSRPRSALVVLWVLSLIIAALPHRVIYAQSKTGTTVGQFLLIEPSARTAAMGNAGVATTREAMSAFFNPGATGFLEDSGVQFTHSLWFADIVYDYAVVALRLGAPNTLFITITSLDSGEIPVRTVEQPLGTGELYSVSDLAAGIGFSRRFTDRFSAGLQAKLVRQTIWNSSMNALALDFGVLYHLPFRAVLGASVSNFGNRGAFNGRDLRIRFDQDGAKFGDNSALPAALETEDFPLPIFFRVGLNVPFQIGAQNELNVVIDAFHPSDNHESISMGVEWAFMDLLFVRGGYQNFFLDETQAGPTLGTGIRQNVAGIGFGFDYAWNDYGVLGGTHRFSFGLTF